MAKGKDLGKARKSALKEALERHRMSYEDGHCTCGVDLKGSYAAADQHFYEVAFDAGVEYAGGGA